MKLKRPKIDSILTAKELFLQHGGILRASEAKRLGVHPKVLQTMHRNNLIERLSRGLYRLADMPLLDESDLVIVAKKIPQSIICLTSALSYHQITTQIPRFISVAIKQGSEPPKLEYPPIRIFWFSKKNFEEGVETHELDGISVRIYSMERTLADCFKYRNKIGLPVALEALKIYLREKQPNLDLLMHYASLCRVGKILNYYLEAIINE